MAEPSQTHATQTVSARAAPAFGRCGIDVAGNVFDRGGMALLIDQESHKYPGSLVIYCFSHILFHIWQIYDICHHIISYIIVNFTMLSTSSHCVITILCLLLHPLAIHFQCRCVLCAGCNPGCKKSAGWGCRAVATRKSGDLAFETCKDWDGTEKNGILFIWGPKIMDGPPYKTCN